MASEVTRSAPPAVSPLPAGGIPRAESPSAIDRLRLVSWERNLSQVGIAELEATVAALTPARLRAWFDSDSAIREVGLLRTCQRVLLLALTNGPECERRFAEHLALLGPWTARPDGEAVRHLFRVAAGLDSRAPGEREIRDQVRGSTSGLLSRHPRPVLQKLFLQAAAAVPTPVGDAAGSVADLAVDWLLPRLAGPRPKVLVIGAGTVGRRAAERLAGAARVTVVYRHRPPDAAWARRWKVLAVPSSSMREAVANADAVIAAAKTTGRVLGASDLPVDPDSGPRWFADLGLPRNVDPAIGLRPGTQLVDLDGLPRGRLSPERAADAQRLVAEAAEAASRELSRAEIEPWVTALRSAAERIRREEWSRALQHAGSVADRSRGAFERFGERLVRRLLEGPTEELRALPTGPEMDRFRRQLLELFHATDPGP